MLAWSVFLMFLVAIAVVTCVVVLLKPDTYFTRHHTIVCPEAHAQTDIEIDRAHRLKTLLRGTSELRVAGCDRWPERQGCDEECLLQVDLKPAVLQRTLRKWYAGKSCALCDRVLTEDDWRQGRFSALDGDNKFVSPAALPLRDLPQHVSRYRPVCWQCHQQQRANAASAGTRFKGDRRGHKEEPLLSA